METQSQRLKRFERIMNRIMFNNLSTGENIPSEVKQCMLDWGEFIATETSNLMERVMRPKSPKKVKMSLEGLNMSGRVLIQEFKGNARDQGWSKEEIEEVIADLPIGSYDNLVSSIKERIY